MGFNTVSGTFRLTGISLTGSGSGTQTYNGALGIYGTSSQIRVDHCHIYNINVRAFQTSGVVSGVFDHNIIQGATGAGWATFGGTGVADPFGDTDWAAASGLGGSNFVYFESNEFLNGGNDCFSGGRWVIRYNTFIQHQGTGFVQTHPTGGSGRDRGCRAWEVYGNSFSNPYQTAFNVFFVSSGTGVIWGNTTVSGQVTNFLTVHSMRRDNLTYAQSPTPTGWGFCGNTFWTGTVNTSGTAVTWASGTQFSVTSGGGGSSHISATSSININGTTYTVSNYNSATSLTLTTSAGTQTGVTYYVPISGWDQDSNTSTGYRCMDQPGQGVGQLLSGNFPNAVNTVTGKISWPNEALEPVYEWMDTFSGTTFLLNYEPDALFANSDFYLWCNAASASGCTSFNGTVGVGSGTLASRPSTCTTGVGYWATDQGSWNQSGSGGQGELFVCTAPNTWGATPYYTPYTYPHPLATNTPTAIPPTNPQGIPH